MDFSKLHGLARVVLCISCPFPNKPRFQSLFNLLLCPKGQSQSTQCLLPRVRCAFDNVLIIPRNSSSMFSLPGSSHFSGIDNYHLEKEWEEEMLIEKRCNSISWAISRHRRPTVWRAALSSTRTFSFYQSAHKKFIWTITL